MRDGDGDQPLVEVVRELLGFGLADGPVLFFPEQRDEVEQPGEPVVERFFEGDAFFAFPFGARLDGWEISGARLPLGPSFRFGARGGFVGGSGSQSIAHTPGATSAIWSVGKDRRVFID